MPALIGFDMLHYAVMQTDSVSGTTTYSTPKRVVGAVEANINPNSVSGTLSGDDGAMETATALGEVELNLTVTDAPLEVQAELLGHKYVNGLLLRGANDVAPIVAIGGRSLKSNGKYRYFWLLKGQMSQPEQTRKTKQVGSIDFQTFSLSGSFVRRDSDGLWIIEADEDDSKAAAKIKTWFQSVVTTATLLSETHAEDPKTKKAE